MTQIDGPLFPGPRYAGKNEVTCNALLIALRAGANVSTAASIVGISRSTIHYWRRTDTRFDQAVEEAKLEGIAKVIRERLAAHHVTPQG
jgi:hypothetical protein